MPLQLHTPLRCDCRVRVHGFLAPATTRVFHCCHCCERSTARALASQHRRRTCGHFVRATARRPSRRAAARDARLAKAEGEHHSGSLPSSGLALTDVNGWLLDATQHTRCSSILLLRAHSFARRTWRNWCARRCQTRSSWSASFSSTSRSVRLVLIFQFLPYPPLVTVFVFSSCRWAAASSWVAFFRIGQRWRSLENLYWLRLLRYDVWFTLRTF